MSNDLAASFSQSGKSWFNGDFNYDGSIDTVDFNLLASNFGQVLPSQPASMPLGARINDRSHVGALGRQRSCPVIAIRFW